MSQAHEDLRPAELRLVRLSAAIALGARDELLRLRRAAPAGEPDRRWREVWLQSHLFAGFPRAVEAASVLSEAGGLGTPEADEREPGSPGVERGRALFDAIYAEQAGSVRASLAGFHPELARWIEEHAYTRVLARPGLEARLRELCAVAALAAQGPERQLASHVRGAVRLGATPNQVRAAIEAVADMLEPGRLARAREVTLHFAR